MHHVNTIENLYGKRMSVYNSHNHTNPGASAGVAFVINKESVRAHTVTTSELVPGRALLLTLKWNNNKKLTILNIYAPNAHHEHPGFWDKIRQKLSELGTQIINLMLGDFNLVEDQIDCSPPRPDDYSATEALRQFRELYHIQDAWRQENPTTRAFMFISNTNSMSRLDRIYTHRNISKTTYDWEIKDTAIPSDHRMILARIVPPHTPYIGAGRWTLPLTLINNETFMNEVTALGTTLQNKLTVQYNEPTEPQHLWSTFKKNIATAAKKAAKIQLAKINNRVKALNRDIRELEQRDDIDNDENQRSNIALLQNEVRHLENKRNKNARAQAQAHWHTKGERINKYWTNTQTPKRPREIIYALHDTVTNKIITRSSEMARIAQVYHDNLQRQDILSYENIERQAAIRRVLSQIPDQQKLRNDDTEMHQLITYDQIATALQSSKNGTATGIDGLPYELWKELHNRHKILKKQNKPSFDIVACMTGIFNNIQTNRTDEEANFSFGWMCPLYKKKERTKIENYRPITLLNTDYKTMTKALATQIATHVGKLLHPDQSGFVPNRSIFDPIRLAETMISYADYMEEDGVIVALDQEKAYDKIDHTYLIDTLKTFRLPNTFINTIATLYKHARTSVIINGIVSTPYRIT